MESARMFGGGVSRYPILGLMPLLAMAPGTVSQQAATLLLGSCIAFYAVIFIIWILIGIWVYRDAATRGMNGALWLIVVLLIGIIGLIVYLVVRTDRPQPLAAQPPPVPEDAHGAVEGTGAEAGEAQAEDVKVSARLMNAGKRMDKVPVFNKLPTELRIVVVLLVIIVVLMAIFSTSAIWLIADEVGSRDPDVLNPNKLEEFSDTGEPIDDYLNEFNSYPMTLEQVMAANGTVLVGTVRMTLEWTDEPDTTELGRVRENLPDNFQLELNVGGSENWTVQSEVVGNDRDPGGGSGEIELFVDVSSLVEGYVAVGNMSGRYIPDEVVYSDAINLVVYLLEAEDKYASGPAALKWNDFGNEFTLTVSCTGLVVPTD